MALRMPVLSGSATPLRRGVTTLGPFPYSIDLFRLYSFTCPYTVCPLPALFIMYVRARMRQALCTRLPFT